MFLEDKAKFAGAANAEPAPFTLESLIAWLRTKPTSEEYCSTSITNCLLCQFYTHEHGARKRWADVMSSTQFVDGGFLDIVAHGDGTPRTDTFGAALSRALAIQAGGK